MTQLSHPFRLTPSGAAATVDPATDQAVVEGITVMATTRTGERVLSPGYGTTDPVFGHVDVAELNLKLAEYGPDATVALQSTTPTSDTTSAVVLTYSTGDPQ